MGLNCFWCFGLNVAMTFWFVRRGSGDWCLDNLVWCLGCIDCSLFCDGYRLLGDLGLTFTFEVGAMVICFTYA